MIDEKTLEEDKRSLELYREGFENYRSLEEDPEGIKALDELVHAGFVI